MALDKIIYIITLLGDMQALDLVRIEDYFKVDIGREKKTKAYQVLEFLNSVIIKNLILREDDEVHEDLRVACYNHMEKIRENQSYIEFSSTRVVTETERNSLYYNDLSSFNT